MKGLVTRLLRERLDVEVLELVRGRSLLAHFPPFASTPIWLDYGGRLRPVLQQVVPDLFKRKLIRWGDFQQVELTPAGYRALQAWNAAMAEPPTPTMGRST